jgi:hypothetical protein
MTDYLEQHKDDEGQTFTAPFRSTITHLKRLESGAWYQWIARDQRWEPVFCQDYFEAVFQAGKSAEDTGWREKIAEIRQRLEEFNCDKSVLITLRQLEEL